MKDRVIHTGTKKPDHRLVKASIIVGSLSLLFSIGLTTTIVKVTQDNVSLNENITHYGQEIDYIENQNRTVEKSYSQK